jgi:RHS repeat-associated protein
MMLVSAANGTVNANYEYGPFGEVVRATGTTAKINPFRFSTKYQDDESDLVYYGFRYYNAAQGRWPSRDPIAERGGANLYEFVGNNSITGFDYVGLLVDGSATLTMYPTLLMTPEEIAAAQAASQVVVVEPVTATASMSVLGKLWNWCFPPCTDDAGATCKCSELKQVEIKNKPGRVGHTWLGTPAGNFGFVPAVTLNPSDLQSQWNGTLGSVDGTINNDKDLKPRGNPKKYKVCPSTLAKIMATITAASQGAYAYNAGNYSRL